MLVNNTLYTPPTAGRLQVALQVNYLNAQGCPIGYYILGVITDVPHSIHTLLHNTSSAYSQCHYTLDQPTHSTRPGSNKKVPPSTLTTPTYSSTTQGQTTPSRFRRSGKFRIGDYGLPLETRTTVAALPLPPL